MKFLDEWNRRLTGGSEERFYLVLLSALTTLAAAAMILFGLDLHRNFVTIACDTAYSQSTVVNTMHGSWFRDSAYDGPNLLGQHSSFILLLIVPIYALFPSVDTLFVLQIAGVYSTVIPLYLAIREILGRASPAFIVAAGALASPLLLHMALAPIHTETWITAAVLWSYFFYRRQHAGGFWASLGFAVCCGEQAALLYVALGLSLFLFDDGVAWRKKYGAWALAGGLGWLAFCMGVLFPLMHRPEQTNVMTDHYAQWNVNSISGLMMTVAQNPLEALLLWLNPIRWIHVVELAGLPVLLAFLSRRSLLLLLPFSLYFLMRDVQFYLYFHAYYFQFAFFAGYMGLAFFLARWDLTTRLGITVLAATLFLNVLTLCPALSLYVIFSVGRDAVFNNTLHQEFDSLSKDAAVYSPHRYSAYLSNRDNMVMGDLSEKDLDFDAMIEARFKTTDVHAKQIDYIVCDLENDQCGWRQGGYDADKTKQRTDNISKLVNSGEWKNFWNQDNVVILKRAEEKN